ncbi:hypothetical protein JN11_00566 [Mucilaginibacter frigoritolerans]|uniref:DoxX-like protein n=1 Tax=Mucilaginibacter frigoritolerans TaxID=652788 RepID=A0A562UGE8_9SPHI|nr:hypothetical protein [Mucilaginibacter frigoritolerans]TWJ04843.1 hypothetical protein JN11_00566 [Mucilaginibacter frigoritolerans]
MSNLNLQHKIHYTLRFATAMCFIGHGSFGIITKPIWVNYFAVFGIGKVMAYQLMPVLGLCDIILGIIILIYPLRIIPLWLVLWGIVTALLRPLSGEPFAEFIERAGNFGAPMALLIFSGGVQFNLKSLFTPISPSAQPDEKTLKQVVLCLRFVVFLLLAGHGWLNLIEKKGLISQYSMLGFTNPQGTATLIGALEIAAAIIVLIKPVRSILIVFLIWKMASELFYPHYEIFEWVERGGSYGAILALWFALGMEKKPSGSIKDIASYLTKNKQPANGH